MKEVKKDSFRSSPEMANIGDDMYRVTLDISRLDYMRLLKPLLNTSDNIGYAVTPTASPKLPSVQMCDGCKLEWADMETCFVCYKEKLGNFA